jgi:phosphatidylinositol alpha-1,6-mannosyltransferase
MKVLALTPGVFDKGGISRYMRFQISALRDNFGEDAISVFSLLGRQVGDLEEPFEVTWCGSVPYSNVTRAHFASLSLKHALKIRPDIILCGHVYLGPLALMLSKISGARFVQNIYGLELWSGLSALRRYALQKADFVISDCHNSAEWVVENRLVNQRPAVIWDCVDVERYCPGPREWPVLNKYGISNTNRFRIVFLGRIHPSTRHKGTERLLRLVSKLPKESFEALICGKGDDLEYLRAEAKRLSIDDRVHFTGAIHEVDMPAIYRSADVFYLVSEVGPGKGEGIPLTPLEAMACGVPVIVGNQDGSREILDGTGGGICVSPDDDGSIIHYFQRLLSDSQYLQSEGQAARRRAESAFGYKQFAEKTIAALESALRN